MNWRNPHPGLAMTVPNESPPALGPRRWDVVCQRCGVTGNCAPGVQLRKSFHWPLFLFTGLPGILLHNASQKRRMLCFSCGGRFDLRTPFAALTVGIFWLLIGMIVLGLIATLLCPVCGG